MRHDWVLIEKEKPLHLHGLFVSQQSAQKHLDEVVPENCRRGLYMDKTLTPESFIVVPRNKG